MTKKRFIQVGCGGWGRHWVVETMSRLIRLELAEPVAIVDIDPATFPDARERYGVAQDRCYTDAKRAFADNQADFVVVVVPPALHESVVDLAIEHGVHVLSEKPVADTMEATCRIHRNIARAGLKMAITMSHRFDQDKMSLKHEIDSGRFGRLAYLVGRNTWNNRAYASWGRFRYEIAHPLLIEGTVHHFDIIRALASSNARTVFAKTWNPAWSTFRGDASALIQIEMENGVQVQYEGSKVNAAGLNGWCEDYFRAECELGTLELDRRKLRVLSDLDGERRITEKRLLTQPAWMNPWLAELFVRWLDGGSPPPNTLDDNIQCMALLFAAVKSAEEHSIVDVQAFLAAH